jgi:hypothetical protein
VWPSSLWLRGQPEFGPIFPGREPVVKKLAVIFAAALLAAGYHPGHGFRLYR